MQASPEQAQARGASRPDSRRRFAPRLRRAGQVLALLAAGAGHAQPAVSDGVDRVVAVHRGQALDVPQSAAQSGALAGQWPWSSTNNTYVPSAGLTDKPGDIIHFDAPAMRTLGRRKFESLNQAIERH